MKWFSAYDGRERERSDLVAQVDFGESLTVQAHAEDADLNVIMRRFGVTGKMPENFRLPAYGDFSEVRDFRSALEAVERARDSFMEMPAETRSRFDNDPQAFLEFVTSPGNEDEMRKLGLLKEPVAPPAVVPPPVVAPSVT